MQNISGKNLWNDHYMVFQTYFLCWKSGPNQHCFVWHVQLLGPNLHPPKRIGTSYGGEARYSKIPYVSWERVCSPKNQGGLGVKNLLLWNKACVAKLVWATAKKKDCMWIMWVHGSYAQDIWKKVLANWGIQMNVEGKDQYITSLKKMHQARRMKGLICAITRNMLMFKGRLQTPAQTVKAIRDQVTQSFAAPSSQS
ncbi:hypothetical protein Cgig2_015853 [Carnegiea gigantea]|uniref:Uncharacterized protein n=1 Tax=Carnegiea gigantea TaxID=171969 RepID=A0A9Q1GQV6_9CARY|nr:hypothetical protein Cgig2_015853 [Carnegiea gigantea]